jgi:hypothetical protein
MLTKEGMFFNTVDDLGEETNLSDKVQKKCVDKLVQVGLLEVKKFGLPCRRYFKMNENDMDIIRIIEQLKLEKGLKSQYLPNGGTTTLPIDGTSTLPIDGTNTCQMAVNNNQNVITKTNKKNLIISSKKNLKNCSDTKPKKDENEKHARKERDRELKKFFFENVWERYPKQHRVGEKLCFSIFKSAIKNGSSQEEILAGFNTYLKVIELNKRNGSEQYIKRLDNWFKAESWKNPNKYMKSAMDRKIEQTLPKANTYQNSPKVSEDGYDTKTFIDIEQLARESENLVWDEK